MQTLRISPAVYETLYMTVGSHPPECGAIIGAPDADPTNITQVWFDRNAGIGKAYYTPTCDRISAIVGQWMSMNNKHHFAGIIHSHHDGFSSLSSLDLRSAAKILRENQMQSLYLGLFHRKELSIFRAFLHGEEETCSIEAVHIVIDPALPHCQFPEN